MIKILKKKRRNFRIFMVDKKVKVRFKFNFKNLYFYIFILKKVISFYFKNWVKYKIFL